MESFFHAFKTELVMHCDYKTRDEARASLFDYLEVFYNRQRRHSTLNYEAPLAFEATQIAKLPCPQNVGKIIPAVRGRSADSGSRPSRDLRRPGLAAS